VFQKNLLCLVKRPESIVLLLTFSFYKIIHRCRNMYAVLNVPILQVRFSQTKVVS